jgi:hypothetical protein
VSHYDPPFPPYDPDLRDGQAARRPAEPVTPSGAEARLRAYQDDLDAAVDQLQQARDAELAAEEDRDTAARKLRLSDECPKVGVFDGVRTTVAYQNAWIEERAAGEEHAYRLAKAARQAASAHLSKLRDQGRFQQSITASARESYRGTNGRTFGDAQ